MPYKSEAQRKFFNSPVGKKKLSEEEVEKWNEESKGQKNLSEKVSDTLDNAINKMNDSPYISSKELRSLIKDIENISSIASNTADRCDESTKPVVKEVSRMLKEQANKLKNLSK